jgi:23S rRNA (cytosine1962-C5)-methyltransferase
MNSLLTVLQQALDKRSHLFGDRYTNAFRLCNGPGDGADSLFADLYGNYILVQGYDTRACELILSSCDIFEKYSLQLPVQIKGILFKNRDEKASAQQNYDSVLLSGQLPPDDYSVCQLGILVGVDLISGLNTGLFLDMRSVRKSLMDVYPQIESMLNLFSYTGLFALHARMNGLKRAINVDISQTVLRKAKSNYERNGLNPDSRDFIREDSGKWIRKSQKNGNRWDISVFDPPTFARGKTGSFSVKNDYSSYLNILNVISERYVLSVINTHSVSRDDYISYHPANWKNEWIQTESDDFPFEKDPYLKVGLWRVR